MSFQELIQKLNPEQRLAVEAIEGPVMLLAGPGTGKTHTLTIRIANILDKTDAKPENILAITFTENAASNMRSRLVKIIGKDAYRIKIVTFHAFCNEIILTNPEIFGFEQDLKQITELEKSRLMEKIIDELDLQYLTGFSSPYHYKRDIIKAISNLKKEGINIDEFEQAIQQEEEQLNQMDKINPKTGKAYGKWKTQEKLINKNKELVKIYQTYQNYLKKNTSYDFDDMIIKVIEKLETNDELLATLQEKYLYILVDEFQDTNGSQSKLLELIGSFDKKPNIFVVGDDDQSIFRFQGANIENMYDFLSFYPDTQVISLKTSYRCPPSVIKASQELIAHNQNTLTKKIKGVDKTLKTISQEKSMVQIVNTPTLEDQNYYILEQTEELIKKGTKPQDIAILYRNHTDARELQSLFIKKGIDTNIQDKQDILDSKEVQQFIELLKYINEPNTNDRLFEILNFDFLNLDKVESYKLSRLAYKAQVDIQEIIFGENYENKLSEEIKTLKEKLLTWQQIKYNKHLIELFEIILNECGILENLKNQKNTESIEAFISLFNFAKQLARNNTNYNLTAFLNDINTLAQERISLTIDYSSTDKGVNFSSVHKAKGLEFDHVFLMSLHDHKWGNKRNANLIRLPTSLLDTIDEKNYDENEEERRLLYVAMTRARKTLTLIHANYEITDGKERELVKSQFLSELTTKYSQEIKYSPDSETSRLVLSQEEPLNLDEKQKTYLSKLVTDFKLSYSALNRYLESPRDFLYEYLIRVPRNKAKEMILGTIIHKAMETYNKDAKTSSIKDDSYYIKILENSLRQEFVIKETKELILKEAKKLLEDYLQNIKNQKYTIFDVEYNFGFRNVFYKDIQLTGKIDKIEWVDEKNKLVKITDYKTARPKTRNEILGKTKKQDETYLRQLQFYKLLTQQDKSLNIKPIEFEIDFIKADYKNTFKRESFTSDEIDTSPLKELIQQVMTNIRALKFDEEDKIIS